MAQDVLSAYAAAVLIVAGVPVLLIVLP